MNTYDVHIMLSPAEEKLDYIKVINFFILFFLLNLKYNYFISYSLFVSDFWNAVVCSKRQESHPWKMWGIESRTRRSCVKILWIKGKFIYAINFLTINFEEVNVCSPRKKASIWYYSLQLEVDPEYHPKIIGRRGAVISKIRSDHDVQINFPRKGDPEEHIITITGYEKNAHSARDDIMKIVNELVRQFS